VHWPFSASDPFIAAGPIIAALSGGATGPRVGGLTGAWVGPGVPEYEPNVIEAKRKCSITEIMVAIPHIADILDMVITI
jgi:hypothetical protein